MTGTLPSELGQLSQITQLFLSRNPTLKGSTIPSEWGQMSNMEYVGIWNNSFVGTVPQELWTYWTNTIMFVIDGNAFTGTIPSELGRWTSLTKLGT